ncbi:iron ABC transporter permease [Candidatus Acetothermia bacterium]|nr:iron ABC transporter permease [Candidatus Acetothermia bacterium]MBI3644235.1 iron ABC transporter permease [Candidatus Acetothermia bacterium]
MSVQLYSQRLKVGRVILIALPLLFLGAFFYLPLFQLLVRGLSSSAGLSLERLSALLSNSYLQHVLLFTLGQAILSMLGSVILCFGLAYFLSHYEFPGRPLLKALTLVPFALPPVAVALGFLLVFGRSGALNQTLMGLFGLHEPPIQILYSISGIVLAHAFYNAPIVARFVTAAWERLPMRYEESARALGAPRWRIFLNITLPMLMPGLISGAMLAFIYSFLSFPIVLAVGGAQFSTIEVEIYRRALIQIDIAGASALATIALIFSLLFTALYLWGERYYAHRLRATPTRQRTPLFADVKSALSPRRWPLYLLIFVTLFFFLAPLVGVFVDSITRQSGDHTMLTLDWYGQLFNPSYSALISASPLHSVWNSLLFALATMCLSLSFGTILSIILSRPRLRGRIGLEAIAMAPLAASPVALGLALLWSSAQTPFQSAWLAIVIAHSVLAIPFVIRALRPAFSQFDLRLYEAARSLGASQIRSVLDIVLPLIRGSLVAGAAFAFAISIAEMSATIMLVQPETLTMPVSVYYLLSSRQFGAASAMSVLMMLVLAFSFVLIERFSEKRFQFS